MAQVTLNIQRHPVADALDSAMEMLYKTAINRMELEEHRRLEENLADKKYRRDLSLLNLENLNNMAFKLYEEEQGLIKSQRDLGLLDGKDKSNNNAIPLFISTSEEGIAEKQSELQEYIEITTNNLLKLNTEISDYKAGIALRGIARAGFDKAGEDGRDFILDKEELKEWKDEYPGQAEKLTENIAFGKGFNAGILTEEKRQELLLKQQQKATSAAELMLADTQRQQAIQEINNNNYEKAKEHIETAIGINVTNQRDSGQRLYYSLYSPDGTSTSATLIDPDQLTDLYNELNETPIGRNINIYIASVADNVNNNYPRPFKPMQNLAEEIVDAYTKYNTYLKKAEEEGISPEDLMKDKEFSQLVHFINTIEKMGIGNLKDDLYTMVELTRQEEDLTALIPDLSAEEAKNYAEFGINVDAFGDDRFKLSKRDLKKIQASLALIGSSLLLSPQNTEELEEAHHKVKNIYGRKDDVTKDAYKKFIESRLKDIRIAAEGKSAEQAKLDSLLAIELSQATDQTIEEALEAIERKRYKDQMEYPIRSKEFFFGY